MLNYVIFPRQEGNVDFIHVQKYGLLYNTKITTVVIICPSVGQRSRKIKDAIDCN